MMFRKLQEWYKYCNLAANTHGKFLQTYCVVDQPVLYCQEHFFHSYLNFLHIVIAVSVGWCCSNPHSLFAAMRLLWFRTLQENRGNMIFFCSFYCAHGKHTVASRIFSVITSSLSFLSLKITIKITTKGRRVLVLGIPFIWLIAGANHAKGEKGGTAKLPQEYHCPWYGYSSCDRKEQTVMYMCISMTVEGVRPPLEKCHMEKAVFECICHCTAWLSAHLSALGHYKVCPSLLTCPYGFLKFLCKWGGS